MPVSGVNQTEGVRIDQVRIEQRRAEEARAEEQKRTTQNDREVSEAQRTTEKGRGEAVDLTA
jgi:hypothetical protein